MAESKIQADGDYSEVYDLHVDASDGVLVHGTGGLQEGKRADAFLIRLDTRAIEKWHVFDADRAASRIAPLSNGSIAFSGNTLRVSHR